MTHSGSRTDLQYLSGCLNQRRRAIPSLARAHAEIDLNRSLGWDYSTGARQRQLQQRELAACKWPRYAQTLRGRGRGRSSVRWPAQQSQWKDGMTSTSRPEATAIWRPSTECESRTLLRLMLAMLRHGQHSSQTKGCKCLPTRPKMSAGRRSIVVAGVSRSVSRALCTRRR